MQYEENCEELGYGSATGILRWLRETVPDKVSKPVQRNWKVDYPEEIKQAAVIDLCESNSSTADKLKNMESVVLHYTSGKYNTLGKETVS